MAIETGRGLPLYARIAGAIRERIASGDLAEGEMVPGENAIADEYRVSRYTAARALDKLAAEGLLTRRPGVGSVVTGAGIGVRIVEVGPGTTVRARLPRPGERAESGAAEWEAVIAVSRPGQPEELYPADSTVILFVG